MALNGISRRTRIETNLVSMLFVKYATLNGISRRTRIETRQYRIGVVLLFYLNPTQPGGPVERAITYEAPFDRCNREKDYEEVWANFEKRFEKE